MIRGSGHRHYKPSQLLTGHVDDFPLIPVAPVDIAPRPILPLAAPAALAAPDSGGPLAGGPLAGGPAAAAPTPAAPPAAPSSPPPEPARQLSGGPASQSCGGSTQRTIDIVVQPEKAKNHAQNERGNPVDYSEMGVQNLRKVYDWIARVLSNRGVPPPEPQFPSISRHRTNLSGRKSSQRIGGVVRSGATKSKTHSASARDHHSRHCTICHHPERAAIEQEFIHWHDPSEIGLDYEVGRRAVYRHAHAAGLFARRERNVRFALGHMVSQAMNITPTSDSILRAIRAYSCLNRRGQWIEPAAHVVVSSGSAARTGLPVSTASGAWEIKPALNPALAAASGISSGGGAAIRKISPRKSKVTRHCVPSRKGRK